MGDGKRHSPERLVVPLTWRETEILALPAGARAALGEEAFDIAWKEGRGMTLDQAIQKALAIGGEVGDDCEQ